jgi:hypothetical protein
MAVLYDDSLGGLSLDVALISTLIIHHMYPLFSQLQRVPKKFVVMGSCTHCGTKVQVTNFHMINVTLYLGLAES